MNPATAIPASARELKLVPGPGWGTGAHETTQLCLQAIRFLAPQGKRGWRMLDFGSGSGILSIGAAALGAEVIGVEIDLAAIQHAEENARFNGLEERVSFIQEIEEARGSFDLVVANILAPILLEAAPGLCERLAPRGVLVLSGLVSTDVPALTARFSPHLGGLQPEVYRRGEWRALVWRSDLTSSDPS